MTAAVLFAIHPFYVPSVIAIVGIAAMVRMITMRRWMPHLARHIIWITLASLPTLAYWGPLTLLDPIHESRAAQNLLLMSPLPYVVAGYGFLLPLAAIGVVHLLRRWRTASLPEQFLVVWTITNTALLWAPIAWQRRFTQGLHVALVLASCIAIAHGIAWLRAHLPVAWRSIICSRATAVTVFVLFFTTTNIVNIARDIVYFSSPLPSGESKYMFFYPTAGFDAMQWLRAHATANDVTLAPGISANFIPGRAARRVYVGHLIETAHAESKLAAFDRFLHTDTPLNDRRAFLIENHIRYLFIPRFDALAPPLESIARDLRLDAVYDNQLVTIYEVPR